VATLQTFSVLILHVVYLTHVKEGSQTTPHGEWFHHKVMYGLKNQMSWLASKTVVQGSLLHRQ
jgi:hypothetical protein